jgi:hypothetical protein
MMKKIKTKIAHKRATVDTLIVKFNTKSDKLLDTDFRNGPQCFKNRHIFLRKKIAHVALRWGKILHNATFRCANLLRTHLQKQTPSIRSYSERKNLPR